MPFIYKRKKRGAKIASNTGKGEKLFVQKLGIRSALWSCFVKALNSK